MRCENLDVGAVPNRDPFARFWRDQITRFADGLPKAVGTPNGEEGFYPRFPFQANYIKGLKRLAANQGDDPDPSSYCEYLGILRGARLRLSNQFEDLRLQGNEPLPPGLTCMEDDRPARRQTNPQGGLPVSIMGPDPSGVNLNIFRNAPRSLRPAPRIDGQPVGGGITREHENTAEMVELYWMALLRDLPFRLWTDATPRLPNAPPDWAQLEADGATLESALEDLNRVREYFAEAYPVGGGPVTGQNIFRGAAFGDQSGPYISQFLLRGNTVPCARGRSVRHRPSDGVIPEGSVPNLQRQATVEPYVDFLRLRADWRCVEQGFVDPTGMDPIECGDGQTAAPGRFIRNLRDLANWVHLDDPAQHFRNAALLMLNEPMLMAGGLASASDSSDPRRALRRTPLDAFPFTSGASDSAGASGDPCSPEGPPFPFARCNPYQGCDDGNTQVGFVTFGPEHVLNAVSEVADLALRAAWWQKWYVHRRLRPEEFGGLVNAWLEDGRTEYRIDKLLWEFVNAPNGSTRSKGLLELIYTRNGFTDNAGPGGMVPGGCSYLLPQVFPEGSPTHPAYPSGHATIAGACATLLKSFFATDQPMTCPTGSAQDTSRLPPAFVTNKDGSALEPARENDTLTVGGELDKLASNISIGRNGAGVHWRSDATQGMELGEAVAANFLYEMAWSLNEEAFCFSFRRFFRPERVTISRTTTYGIGGHTRTVEWRVEQLNAQGLAVGTPESLVRTATFEGP